MALIEPVTGKQVEVKSSAEEAVNLTSQLLGSYTVTPQILQQQGFEARNGGLFDIRTNQMVPGIQYTPGETTILGTTSPDYLNYLSSRNTSLIQQRGFAEGQAPIQTTPTAPSGILQQRTLIDIANSRPDVLAVARSQGGDPFVAGTGANTWLNDWWNRVGATEFPGVSLKQPLAELSAQTKAAQDAVDKLGGAGTVKLGEGSGQEVGTPPPGSVDTAGAAAIAEGIKASTPTQEALKVEIARIEAQRTAEASSLKTLIGAQPTALSSDELMRQAFKNLGLPEDFTKTQFQQLQTTAGEIQSLTLSLNAVNTREQQKLLAIEGQAVTMGTINSQSDQAKRSFLMEKSSISADITAKAAYLQALQGNFQLVTQLVDKAVNYAFMDQQQKINDYRWMYSNYKDEMNNLTSREQQLFDTLLSSIERETAAQKADMRDKISLYINAGIPIPDMATLRNQSFEEAAQYVSTHGGDPLAQLGRELELRRQSELEMQNQLRAAGFGGTGGGGGGEDTILSPANVRRVQALGADDLSEDVQNIIVNSGMTDDEQRSYIYWYRKLDAIGEVDAKALVQKVVDEVASSKTTGSTNPFK